MIFDDPDYPEIGVPAGWFDQPDLVPPVVQYGTESRVGWYKDLNRLPGDAPAYSADPQGMLPQIQGAQPPAPGP